MSSISIFRRAVRVWFVATLAAALLLGFLSLKAQAAPTDTQPKTADGEQSSKANVPTSVGSTATVQVNEPLVYDMSAEVAAKVKEISERTGTNGQYIFGQESMVERLQNKFAVSEGRAVVVQGDPAQGGNGVMDEYSRLNPYDKVYRLNLKKLASYSDAQATEEFKALIYRLEEENVKAGSLRHVVLYVSNLAALQQGTVISPILQLWTQIVRRANLYFMLEADPATIKNQINENRFKVIPDMVDVLVADGPEFKNVVDQLLVSRESFETAKVKISMMAIEEAARIAVRYRGAVALRYAKDLLQAAVRMIENDQNKGSSLKSRIDTEIASLNLRAKVLASDLAAETDENAKAALKAKHDSLLAEIARKTVDSNNLGTPSGHKHQLAGIELELMELEKQLGIEKSKSGWWNTNKDSIQVIDSKIKAKTEAKLRLEQELLGSEDDSGKPATRVGGKQIVSIAANWLGRSASSLSSNLDEGIRNIGDIKKVVFKQDHVVDAIEKRLVIRTTHLNEGRDITPDEVEGIKQGTILDSARPVGSYWFAGNTGVGKTEVAKQLADVLGYELVRFDMSEFAEKHTVSRLIGAPPGYVGFGERGEMTGKVQQNDGQVVVLLDEIEKAHPDLFPILLQVLDDGRLTDSQGTVNFNNVVLIMTSNLAKKIAGWDDATCINFLKEVGKWEDSKIQAMTKNYDIELLRREAYKIYVSDPTIAASEHRTPLPKEFLARIDELIVFHNLDLETGVKIAEKTTRQLVKRLKYFYDITLKLSDSAIEKLMEQFNEEEGGRSMRRAFDDFFREPIAQLVYKQKVSMHEVLVADVPENSTDLKFTSKPNDEFNRLAAESTGTDHPTIDAIKGALLSEQQTEAPKREALSATGALIRKIFNPELLIEERLLRAVER